MQIKYSYSGVPTLNEFAQSDAFMRGICGPFGSGKSSVCVVEIIKRGLAQDLGPDGVRRTRWAVVRSTYGELKDTTIRTFHQWFPPAYFGKYNQTDHDYTITAFDKTVIEVLFRALDRPDHVKKLLSMDLTGAWINEARETPWTIIDAMEGRVGRYPAIRDGGPTWHGIMLDTNPPDVDSKWYEFFEVNRPSKAVLFKQPSGLSGAAENLSNLPGGRKYYENLAEGKDPEWIKVYIHGEYGFVVAGKPIYPEYNDALHCQQVSVIDRLPIYRGFDFGLTPACVFGQVTALGQFNVIDELVSDNMGIERFSDEVIAHSSQKYPGYEFIDIGDPAGLQRSQTDEKTCFQIMRAKGIEIEAGLQTLAIRLECVRKPLRTLSNGKPQFQLHPRCKMLRKGFQGGYAYRRLKTSGEKYTDMPDKNAYSHPHDALQYLATRLYGEGLTSQPTGKEEPTDDRYYAEDRSPIGGY